MRILFGSDIVHVINNDSEEFGVMGVLFQWIEKLRMSAYIDFPTLTMLSHIGGVSKKYQKRFNILKKVLPKSINAVNIEKRYSAISANSGLKNNQCLNLALAQLAFIEKNEVDLLITDNLLYHEVAKSLYIEDRVYTIDDFIDKCSLEHRELDPSKGLILKKRIFSEINIDDPFFDSFRRDYPEYNEWALRKANDTVFCSYNGSRVIAFLKLKVEDNISEYNDITPVINYDRVLKISSFKIQPNRTKLAERFLRIIFNAAISSNAEAIYVTLYDNYSLKHRLRELLEKWGFKFWSYKNASNEIVLLRDFRKNFNGDLRHSFPFHSLSYGVYIVPLHRSYLSVLLGDKDDFTRLDDIEPYKNAISKVLILQTTESDINFGSVLLFYQKTRIKSERGIVGVGVVERIISDIEDRAQFMSICRKRSIFTDDRLKSCWDNIEDKSKVCIVEFLYITKFQDGFISESDLENADIKTDQFRTQYPVAIDQLTFRKLIKGSQYENDFVAD